MTLSQTAILTKQIITISICLLTLGLVSFIGYKIWYAHYLSTLPPVEEKPDTKFGLLPLPDFPKSQVSSSNFSYSIDTSSGNLPKVGDANFEKLVKVYFITKTFSTLLSSENSKTLAEKFNIKTQPQVLSETKYRFEDKDKTLTVDLDSGNFAYQKEATISGTGGVDDDKKLVSDFQRNLQSLGVLKEDLISGRSKILKAESGNIAQISLWPKAIGSKQILTSQFDVSPINAKVYKSADNLENYLSLDFTYFPIDLSTFATYPIKTAEEAFENLKSGKGVVVIESAKPQVSITSIYLSYYLPENYTPYLQPIFVFEGPHFVAYVPSISSDFVETK